MTCHEQNREQSSKKLARQKKPTIPRIIKTDETRCDMTKGLFTTLNNKFKLQYNDNIKSLQFCKLGKKKMNENAALDWQL